jgi:heme-degrading monooxygenase HmoA
MILEMVVLNVKPGFGEAFEQAFSEAQTLISSMPGCLNHQLQKCIETPNRYLLLVHWRTIEDHMVGFRGSDEFQEWRARLHHFYDPLPVVEHYELLFGGNR